MILRRNPSVGESSVEVHPNLAKIGSDSDNDEHLDTPVMSTDDEDDEGLHDERQLRDEAIRQRKAMVYVLRYETMVRQQEAEDMATLEHVKPCLERLSELIKTLKTENNTDYMACLLASNIESSEEWSDGCDLTKKISYEDLKLVVEYLTAKQDGQGDSKNGKAKTQEFMTTDNQLMMVLQLLSQKVPENDDATLTWAELMQAYKICLVGMSTLQHVPGDTPQGQVLRARIRDRTLAMMSLFEAPSTRLFENSMDSAYDAETLDREAVLTADRSPGYPDVSPKNNSIFDDTPEVPQKSSFRRRGKILLPLFLMGLLGLMGFSRISQIQSHEPTPTPSATTMPPSARKVPKSAAFEPSEVYFKVPSQTRSTLSKQRKIEREKARRQEVVARALDFEAEPFAKVSGAKLNLFSQSVLKDDLLKVQSPISVSKDTDNTHDELSSIDQYQTKKGGLEVAVSSHRHRLPAPVLMGGSVLFGTFCRAYLEITTRALLTGGGTSIILAGGIAATLSFTVHAVRDRVEAWKERRNHRRRQREASPPLHSKNPLSFYSLLGA